MKKHILFLGAISLFALSSISQTTVELVKDINPTGSSEAIGFQKMDNQLYFYASDNGSDYALWTSDGTGAGTQKIKDITPITFMYELNSELYLGAGLGTDEGLWKTDGTSTGTQFIKNVEPSFLGKELEFVELNGKLYFSGYTAANDVQFWVTDGTSAGTQLVKVINPTGPANPVLLTRLNNKLYFFADDGNGTQLWVSDGTSTGTQILKEINPSGLPDISFFEVYNNKLYFEADDGNNGSELWVSDGTAAGTSLLVDINSGGDSGPIGFKELNNDLYFAAVSSGSNYQLWKTDGTTTGTVMVKDMEIAIASYPNKTFFNHNGKLYFAGANIGGDSQLWSTDGTSSGTTMVKEINSTSSSFPANFAALGNKLFFTAETTNGRELFESDGTTAGTKVIAPDIAPNSDPCYNTVELYEFNDAIYFLADYTSVESEAYKIYDPTLSVDTESDLISFKAYPNPASDQLTITTEKNTSFSILDMTGKVLKSFDVNQQKDISISELSVGIYFLRENTTGAQSKIVKQ